MHFLDNLLEIRKPIHFFPRMNFKVKNELLNMIKILVSNKFE